MINSVTITNHVGESMTMELRFPEKSGFLIQKIEGLGPSKAEINLTKVTGMDGSIFNSSYIESKNIVFSLLYVDIPTIEDARHKSYRYFPLKKLIKIEIETDKRTSEIYGYVESNEPDIFNENSGCTISILCPSAYFYDTDLQLTTFSSVISLFEFPFSNESLVSKLIEFSELNFDTTKNIVYYGDADIGLLLHIHAIGAASEVVIINTITNQYISIDDSALVSISGSGIILGDDIYISTEKGNKYAFLVRGGNPFNILNALGPDPDWFTLEPGDNIFGYDAATGLVNLQFEIINNVAYNGV